MNSPHFKLLRVVRENSALLWPRGELQALVCEKEPTRGRTARVARQLLHERCCRALHDRLGTHCSCSAGVAEPIPGVALCSST